MICEAKSSRDWCSSRTESPLEGNPDDVGAVSGNREELPLSEEAIERLHEAENVLRDLASQLRAFALNETLGGYAVRLLGYDPLTASGGLFGLSNSLDTYGGGRDFHRKTIAEALRVDVNMI